MITLALSLPAVVLCLSVHEAAHGAAAYLLGDRTARDSGRLTLSPRAHIDPWGFLCLLLFGFGWARPVPVNISNFKNRRAGMALTALAGPLVNFIIAFIAFCIYIPLLPYQSYPYGGGNPVLYVIGQFVMIVGSMSVGLGGRIQFDSGASAGWIACPGRSNAVFLVAASAEISSCICCDICCCAVDGMAGRFNVDGNQL